jgi:hypothetical protein
MDDYDEKPSAQGARVRLGHNPSSSEASPPETALEWEKLRLERQKYALEARLKRRELQNKNGKSLWKDLLTNPVMIAIVGGIITIFTGVITFNFNASESRQAEAAKARLAQESTKETLQADLIKKFVESPRTETVRENLRFLVDAGLIPSYAEKIKKYLDSNRGVAPQVGGGIEFLPTGVSVADDIKVQLKKLVERFKVYLQRLGFDGLDEDIQVSIYSKEKPPDGGDPGVHAFYYKKVIFVRDNTVRDVPVILGAYTHYPLGVATNSSKSRQNEIEVALAHYLPASFLDSEIIGAGLGPEFGLGTSIETVDSSASYKRSSDIFERGGVWAAALWACRVRVGQQPVDRLILPAWRQAMGVRSDDDDDRVAEEFGKALNAATPPLGSCFSAEIANRKLPKG